MVFWAIHDLPFLPLVIPLTSAPTLLFSNSTPTILASFIVLRHVRYAVLATVVTFAWGSLPFQMWCGLLTH